MKKTRSYLQLMRFPALFTAMSDILLGFLLTHSPRMEMGNEASLLHDGCLLPFCLLLLSSSSLYLAGMIFNDIFDRKIDAVERPQRPIPSGQVPLRNAVLLGTILVILGVVAAAIVGRNAVTIAGLLVIAIFAYNRFLKKTIVGPLSMGSCRFLNILLGCSAIAVWNDAFAIPHINVAAAMMLYIVGVTLFAKQEAASQQDNQQAAQKQLAIAAATVFAGLLAILFVATNSSVGIAGAAPPLPTIFAWFVILFIIGRPLYSAITKPSPQQTQATVRTMLQCIILIDALLIDAATGHLIFAIATAALLIPTRFIGRWLYIT